MCDLFPAPERMPALRLPGLAGASGPGDQAGGCALFKRLIILALVGILFALVLSLSGCGVPAATVALPEGNAAVFVDESSGSLGADDIGISTGTGCEAAEFRQIAGCFVWRGASCCYVSKACAPEVQAQACLEPSIPPERPPVQTSP